jgi:hypothetical protein
MTRAGDDWNCEECGVPQGRHDMWHEGKTEGLCGDCHEVEKNNAKKDEVEHILIGMWASIGIDIPDNYEDIVQDCYEDVLETADPDNWHSGDVSIAFRRWIEKQGKEVEN